MKTALITLALVALCSAPFPALAAGKGQGWSVPDFTKGDAIPAKAKHDWTLGATGARAWIFSDKLSTSEARQIAITKVEKGSPADGVLAVGDVILGVRGKRFSYDPRTEFGKALTSAETTSLPPPMAETQPGEILFCERNAGRDYAGHYYANFGYDCGNENHRLYGADGGRLAIYSPKTGSVRTLLEDARGAIRDPQVHYDGTKVLFSYRKGGTHHYNLYEMNLDGTGLRQITQGDWDDVEPAYLPDGGIVFCSTRCKRYVLCWLAPVAVLFRCNADGSGLRQLSSNSVPENTPAVSAGRPDPVHALGYVNRDAVSFHHLWTMNPDGTGVMVVLRQHASGRRLHRCPADPRHVQGGVCRFRLSRPTGTRGQADAVEPAHRSGRSFAG